MAEKVYGLPHLQGDLEKSMEKLLSMNYTMLFTTHYYSLYISKMSNVSAPTWAGKRGSSHTKLLSRAHSHQSLKKLKIEEWYSVLIW